MDAALIGAVFAGVTGLVTAIGAILMQRQRKVGADVDDLEAQVIELRARIEAALVHIYELRVELAAHGVSPPPLPDELTRRRARRDSA